MGQPRRFSTNIQRSAGLIIALDIEAWDRWRLADLNGVCETPPEGFVLAGRLCEALAVGQIRAWLPRKTPRAYDLGTFSLTTFSPTWFGCSQVIPHERCTFKAVVHKSEPRKRSEQAVNLETTK